MFAALSVVVLLAGVATFSAVDHDGTSSQAAASAGRPVVSVEQVQQIEKDSGQTH